MSKPHSIKLPTFKAHSPSLYELVLLPSSQKSKLRAGSISRLICTTLIIATLFFVLAQVNNGAERQGHMNAGLSYAVSVAQHLGIGNEKVPMEKDCERSNSPIELPHMHKQGQYEPVPLNRTLGFEKIFVLNLPQRADRRDIMTLMGSAADLQLDFFNAMNGDEATQLHLPEIELHQDLNERNLTNGQLACYRSNLNIMRYIVENKISSALIIQDDADWDVNFRLGLQRLQGPFAQLLQGMKPSSLQCATKADINDPWSIKDWDIFWLGSSYEREWPDKKYTPYVLYDDDLVTGEESVELGGKNVLWSYGLRRAKKTGDPLQRLVQRSRRPVAMAAYVVTLSGASAILARGTKIINQPFDSTVCSLSRVNGPGYRADGCILTPPLPKPNESALRSYTVWPPLVNQFRSPDGARDSDLTESRRLVGSRPGSAGFALEIKDGLRERILQQEWHW